MKLVQQKIKEQEVLEAINRVTNTDDGQILMAYLCHNICGFFNNIMSMDEPHKTQVFAAKRGVYGSLRKAVKPSNLVQIEYGIEIVLDQPTKKKVKKDDRRSSSTSG